MEKHVKSSDGVDIFYELSGQGPESLIFVHGWMGSGRWWDQQAQWFAKSYQVVQLDLAGHGRSGKNRPNWSVAAYADDISAVVQDAKLANCHLIGHSMSGSNVIDAVHILDSRVRSIILVDTLLDLDAMPDLAAVAPMFADLRANYRATIEGALAQFLLLPSSPEAVRQRLRQEMLAVEPEHAIAILEPFYRSDIRPAASQLKIPVRAINASTRPTNATANRKYFRDFDYKTMDGVGHYPMLEAPDAFNQLLAISLKDLSTRC